MQPTAADAAQMQLCLLSIECHSQHEMVTRHTSETLHTQHNVLTFWGSALLVTELTFQLAQHHLLLEHGP